MVVPGLHMIVRHGRRYYSANGGRRAPQPRRRRRSAPLPSWAAAVHRAARDRSPETPQVAEEPRRVDASGSSSAASCLHLLWTTPVWTVNAIDAGWVEESLNDRLVQVAATGYAQFARQQTRVEERLRDDMCWLNNAFFEWQQMQYHSQGGWPDLYGCADYPKFVALLERGVGCMALAGALPHSTRHAAADASAWQVWCALHHDGISHAAHTHADVLLSGTYYAQVAEGSAPLELYGPAGWAGPEERDRSAPQPVWQWQPRRGDLVLFPPWAKHAVPPSSCSIGPTGDGAVRTAFSFNLLGGGWEASANAAQRVVISN
eukprot:COSAG02_NODE_2634_length_8374_cov_12.795166_2_plen_318_part_00